MGGWEEWYSKAEPEGGGTTQHFLIPFSNLLVEQTSS